MVQAVAHLLQRKVEQPEIDDHAGLRVGHALDRDFGAIGMAMHPPAAIGADDALQGVGRFEAELLAQFEHHGIPIILWVCRLSRHLGFARQNATAALVLAAPAGPSMG